jgi:hypothetical protein
MGVKTTGERGEEEEKQKSRSRNLNYLKEDKR